MPVTRLPAKLARPRLFAAIDRERLFGLLDKQRGRALVWIAGPPGAGKTTLVTSYFARERVTPLWYRMDESDADPATFFSYLAQAARALTRKRSLDLPALTAEYLLDLPAFARRYFGTLFGALPEHTALVFDAYEAVSGSALDALVAIAIAEAPPGVRVMITSREAPPAALAHLEAKGSLALIPWGELRLTGAEAKEIAAAGRLPAAQVDVLHRISDGWAAGFVVLVEHVRRSGMSEPDGSGQARESLFAYFVNEMFVRAEKAVRTVLVRTALMPGFTAAQAQALCPGTEAPAILERLYRRHYFIDRSAGPEPVYRYHALFQEFLVAQGQRLLDPGERTRLLGQAAELLEVEGRGEDALVLYTEAQAWPQAARLICALAPGLLGEGRNAILANAIGALPQAVIDDSPWLAYWLGTARVIFDPPAGRCLLEAAYSRFDAMGDATGAVLASAGIVESYHLGWSDMHPLDHWADEFEAQVLRQGPFPSVEMEIRVLSAFSTFFLLSSGKHVELIERHVMRAVELALRVDDPTLRLCAASSACFALIARGDWSRLRQLVDIVDQPNTWRGVLPVYRILWSLCMSWMSHQYGDHRQASRNLDLAVAVAEEFGIRALDMLIFGAGAHAALNANDLPRARAQIDGMRRRLDPGRALDMANYDHLMSLLKLAEGDPHSAVRHARAAVKATVACGTGHPASQCRIGLALALLDLGDRAAALDEADLVIRHGETTRLHLLQHAGLLLKADALHGSDRAAESLEALRAALELGRELDIGAMFPWAPVRFAQRTFDRALNESVEPAYVRDLVRKLAVPPPPDAGERWPWPVRIYTLGRFEVHIDGVKVEYSRKLPKRPLALLKFLLARRGEARMERAIDALWTDEEADAAANALEAALHRLRRLLGGPSTVELHDGQLSLDRTVIWVDAFAFEQALAAAAEGNADRYANALESYRGHFLPGDQGEAWSISTRERLHSRYIRAVTTHGQALQRAGELEAAAAHYARAIDVDDLIEAFYQGLMQCQLARGLRSEGLAAYERLKRMLAAELGLAPAAESERLHRALRAM